MTDQRYCGHHGHDLRRGPVARPFRHSLPSTHGYIGTEALVLLDRWSRHDDEEYEKEYDNDLFPTNDKHATATVTPLATAVATAAPVSAESSWYAESSSSSASAQQSSLVLMQPSRRGGVGYRPFSCHCPSHYCGCPNLHQHQREHNHRWYFLMMTMITLLRRRYKSFYCITPFSLPITNTLMLHCRISIIISSSTIVTGTYS